MIRGNIVTPTERGLFEFGEATAIAFGLDGCARMTADDQTLAIIDLDDPAGKTMYRRYLQQSGPMKMYMADRQIKREITTHYRTLFQREIRWASPLKAIWQPHSAVIAIGGSSPSTRPRKGEIWAAVVYDRRVTRWPIDYELAGSL